MDAKFQSSFIPKQPLTPGQSVVEGHISLFYLISLIVFIVVLGLAGAAFIATKVIQKNITSLNQDLVAAQNSYELATIDALKRTSLRITAAKNLLDSHVAFSHFFDMLNESTYKKVAFTGMTYQLQSGKLSVNLEGKAQSFNTLTLQSEEFRDSPGLAAEPSYSDFKLDDKGNISFKAAMTVDPKYVLYKTYLGH